MDDIRVSVCLPQHPKAIKLVRLAGECAFRCLIQLWCFTAQNRPKGILSGMDNVDIAIASGWAGDADEWVSALLSTRFLDDGDPLTVHDWEINNPWAFHSPERSEQALDSKLKCNTD